MDNLYAARLVSDLREVQEEMRTAVERFAAYSDDELAQLDLGGNREIAVPRLPECFTTAH